MVQNARGTRDYLPQQQIARQKIISTLRTVFERFGYSPLDTPALERMDVLSAKYAGGEEIVKEMFTLKDQGERDLGLRFDLTVPLARVVASNPDLKMPFKRYHIDKVWRDGPVSLGRYREFMQCDVDCIGSGSLMADAEMVRIIDEGFHQLGLKVEIRINSIHVLNGILAQAQVPQGQRGSVILTLDKLAKAGEAGVRKELHEKGVAVEHINALFELCSASGANEERLAHLTERIKSEEQRRGVRETESVLALLTGLHNKVVFEPNLARGLSYYTGMIVETFLVGSPITSAVCSGGRYDGLIGSLTETGNGYPAIGVSFGVDRIFDAMSSGAKKTVTQCLVVPINTVNECMALAVQLREAGINTEVAYEKGISKALDYANSLGIPSCMIVGQRELAEEMVKLKIMESGEEKMVSVADAIAAIKKL